ncbi:efflux RND transporter periplasmic adaptor subunit [Kolteria novifilia]|uniref:efflux RND transporter periplasmic adaptor subunit n=1 Tax=Kolteria novifilia TaxID=2527975 RepID=UPI003AF3F70F
MAIAVVVAGSCLAWVAIAKEEQPESIKEVARAVPVGVTELEEVEEYTSHRFFTGTFVAQRRAALAFERSAKLIEVFVDQGDSIAKGQPIARLDCRNLEAHLREMLARHKQVRAELEELRHGPRKETIAAAKAEVADLKAQWELQKVNHQRHEALFRRGSESREAFDESTFGLASLRARYEAAHFRLEELEEGTRAEKLAAQEAVVEQLAATIEDIRIDIEDSTLVAPFAGTIATRHVDEGELVSPQTAIVSLVEDADLEFHVGLPAGLASQVVVGQPYDIVAGGETHRSYADALSPELDMTTRTRTCVFVLEPLESRTLVPGQIGRIELEERVEAEGFWLPTDSLARGTRGLWSVFAVVDDAHDVERVESRDVEILHTEGERVLVRGTIEAGDRVVEGGAHRLVPGQQVRSSR